MEAKLIDKLKKELTEELSYIFLKNMSSVIFKNYVTNLFRKLADYKTQGLIKEDLTLFINNLFYEVSDRFEEDKLFEQRFGIISEEIMALDISPNFWDMGLEDYLRKWDKYFEYEEKGDWAID
jgi:hypothetical protein